VSIGENCSINGSIIKNTIIDDDSKTTEVTLVNSLIGKGYSVSGNPMQTIVADFDGIRIFCAADETGSTDHIDDSLGPG
jgi:hypothetical protein